MSDVFPQVVQPIKPRITMKGMEYLEENSMMQKASRLLCGSKEIVPGI